MQFFFSLLLCCSLSLSPSPELFDYSPSYGEKPVIADYPAHLSVALSYVGITEAGNNTGPEIDAFLASVNLPPGNPYCAAFVSHCLIRGHATRPNVRSALARDFVRPESLDARKVLLGQAEAPVGAILVYRRGQTIFGHTGFVLRWDEAHGTTVEGNTSPGATGSQADGEGVYIRQRTIYPGNHFRITDFTPVSYE